MAQTFYGQLEVIYCANCGIPFGITPDYQERRRKDHAGFHCPNGHSNVYKGESEEEKLRRENQRLVQNRAYLEDQIRDKEATIEHEKKRATAFKGHVSRIKNRVGAGVCPCCNRTFQDLARHMETKHSDYRKKEEVA